MHYYLETIETLFLPYQHIWIYAALFYLCFVFGVSFRKNNSAVLVFFQSLWNLCLSIFSCMGLYVLGSYAYETVEMWGLESLINHHKKVWDYQANEVVWRWTKYFIISKIPELLDTVFLKLKGKEPIFLQWFHHVVTMIYAYYIGVLPQYRNIGFILALMNYSVHSVMYLYFAIHPLLGKKSIIRKYAFIITYLQTIQMFCALFSYTYSYVVLGFDFDHFGFGMYCCYAFCFTKLLLSKISGKKKVE